MDFVSLSGNAVVTTLYMVSAVHAKDSFPQGEWFEARLCHHIVSWAGIKSALCLTPRITCNPAMDQQPWGMW